MPMHLLVRIVAAAALLGAMGCGDLERSNPLDPQGVGGGEGLGDALVGSWGRDDPDKNEVYVFRGDARAELHDYTALDGGDVDRNAPYPQTRERVFSTQLTILFTDASSNQPGDVVTPPSLPKMVEISIKRGTLTLKEPDGNRLYSRLQ